MSDYPLSRPITAILNEVRRTPRVDWDALRDAVEEGLAYTDALESRLTAGFSLLAPMEGAADLRMQFETVISGQRAMLQQLADAAARQDLEVLGASLLPLEHSVQRVAEVVHRLRRMEQEMPRFSDIPVLDEIITLALNHLKGKADCSRDLMARLPALREFILYLESVGEGFAARHPEQETVAGAFARSVQSLKEVAGGFFLYLQETRDPVDLSNALTLLDRTLGGLGACFQAMRQAEYASLEFSEDPVLDRLARSIEDLKAGEPVLEEVDRHLARVVRNHRALARDVALLELQTFMPLSLRDRYLPRMVELLERMDSELALLHGRPADPHAMAGAVNRFQALGEEMDQAQAELEEHLAARPSLAESAHFDELVSLLQGAYLGSVPDSRLEAKAQMLLALQEAFRRRLALELRRHPPEAERLQGVLHALDGQQQGLETVMEYLGTGQRDLLLQAYEQLLPATLHLIEHKRQAALEEPGPGTVLCVHCSTANAPGSSRCSNCARPLPAVSLGVGIPTEVLDLYDSGAVPGGGGDSQALSENFQFLVDVVDDAVAGVLPPEEARELLLPFWETVVMVEIRAHESVQGLVASVGDEMLSSYQEELKALVAFLKETLSTVFAALEHHDLGSLAALREQAVEVGEALGRFHQEVEQAGRA